jgi:hypothetical protein
MEKSADALLATEWWRATDADILAAIADAEELHRRAYAVTLAVHAEARARNLTGGYDSTRVAVHDAARISVVEAARRERHLDLLDKSALTRTAVTSGEVGADHLDVIVKTLAAIPANTGLDDREAAESLLVDQARTLDSRGLKLAAKQILAWLDQDGTEPIDAPEPPVNALHIDTARDGRVHLTGHLGPEAGALLTGLLSPLAKPRPTDGVPDLRGVGERNSDAFAELLQLAANAAAAPVEGGERPHLTVTMSLTDLRAEIGRAQLGGIADLGSLTARQARRIACDAKVTPMVLDSDSQPLDVGRAKRTAPPGVRKALVWRDGGCAFPACEKPSEWTDSHHIRHWADGGPTTVANMVLLCRRHHTLVHHSEWQVRVRNQLPEFLPPAFIDPERQPRRNTLHGVRSPVRTIRLRKLCLTG